MTSPADLNAQFLEEDEGAVEAAVSALLDHAHGRKLLWWLLEISGVGRQPFTQNALVMSFNCGELNIGQRVLERILSVSPEGYVIMMKEKADERKHRDDALNRASGADDPFDGSHDPAGD